MALERRSALVTGGAGAIGSAIADALAEHHDVQVADTAGSDPVDLGEESSVRAFAQRAFAQRGCQVLVHAAANFERADLEALDPGLWRRVQAVNVEAALWLAQEALPSMRAAGWGRIIFVVSDTVWNPPAADLLPYVASKAALIGVARTLARDLGAHGVTVNCVAPGLTDTPAARSGMPAEHFAAAREAQAVRRTLVPDDVANAVAYLASDAASAISGQTLNVDGGLVLR